MGFRYNKGKTRQFFAEVHSLRQGYRILRIMLIIVGLILLSIPLFKWGAASYRQYRALAAWEEQQEPVPEEEDDEIPDTLPQEEGMLEIPKINLRAVVIHGVSEEDLKLGPGFYPQSKHPEGGNVSIAAHRGVYGAWFRNLDRLVAGDEILLRIGGKTYQYRVREQFITHSRDWSVVESGENPELTLTTCLYTTTTKRLIVKADLVDTTTIAPTGSDEGE